MRAAHNFNPTPFSHLNSSPLNPGSERIPAITTSCKQPHLSAKCQPHSYANTTQLATSTPVSTWYLLPSPNTPQSTLTPHTQFLTTIDPSLNTQPARTIGSHLWYIPYVTLSPSTCFVLDSGTGTAVGYCIGTPSTSSFAQRWRNEFVPSIDPAVVPRPDTVTDDPEMETENIKGLRKAAYEGECSDLLYWPAVLEEFPAHLHINFLPEYQRRGYGRELVGRFLDEVKGQGARGVHLGMARHSVGARAFYGKIGFETCEQVLDGGESGQTGVNGGSLTLVKKL
jgi:GNAT superfamily N-acetyltransferase